MVEKVSTGGNVTFAYGKSDSPKLSKEEEYEIKEAYSAANERKDREKKKKIITWVIVLLIVIALILYYTLK